MATPETVDPAAIDSFEGCHVALSVSHDATRARLVDWLDGECSTETVEPAALAADVTEPDVIVLDRATLAAARDGIDALRAAAAPAYLPVLLVASPADSAEPSAAEALRSPAVDDVAATPLSRTEVVNRVRSLLRVRLLSRRITTDLDRYLSAMDAAGEGITIADVTRPDEPLVYANDAFGEITGYDPGDVLGRNCRFLQGEGTDPDAVARMRAAIDAREPVTVRLRNYRRDGTPFWNRIRLLPIEEDGEVTHYVGVQRDVTDRVQAEEQLGWYRTVVQAAGDPIYTLDAEGRFTDVNDAFVAFTGHDRDALLGTHASMVIDDQDVVACEAIIADLLADPSRSREAVEIVVETTEGDRRLCELSIGLLPGERFQGTVGVVRDITEPKGREQRLAVLERVLRHNLKNNMSVIIGRMDALADSASLDADAREHVAVATRVAEDLIGISDAAREFRDVIALRKNEPSTCDAAELVREVVATKREAFPQARLSVDAPAAARVRTRGRLRVAVDELVENAIEHTDRDRPTVEVTVRGTADDVVVRVADDGPGIPEMERSVIAASTEQPLEHGSGLGLWLVTWTVEQSGGSIDIADRDPRGTVVTLRLPRADAA